MCGDFYEKKGVVYYRPGSRILFSTLYQKYYVIDPGFTLREIYDPANDANDFLPRMLYGPQWKQYVVKPDNEIPFWYFTIGGSIKNPVPHDGMLIQPYGTTKKTIYLVEDQILRPVKGSLPQFLKKDVRKIVKSVFQSLPIGDPIFASSIVANPSQL